MEHVDAFHLKKSDSLVLKAFVEVLQLIVLEEWSKARAVHAQATVDLQHCLRPRADYQNWSGGLKMSASGHFCPRWTNIFVAHDNM